MAAQMDARSQQATYSVLKLHAEKLLRLNLLKNAKQDECEMSHSMADKKTNQNTYIIKILYDNCVFKQSSRANEYSKHDKSGWRRWRLLLIPFPHLKENELCGRIGGVPLKSERRRRARNPATERLRTL